MSEQQNKSRKDSVVKLDTEEVAFVLEPTQVEVGAGYTLCVDYNEDGEQVIDIKTYGEVDIANIRREIQRLFPEAQIRRLSQKGSVTVVKKRRIERSEKSE